MAYQIWKTKDGRRVEVKEMTDLHVVQTIRAIEQGRVFPKVHCGGNAYSLDEACRAEIDNDEANIVQDSLREKWLTVFKAEAIRRDIDWSQSPTRRVSLVEWLLTSNEGCVLALDKIPQLVRAYHETMARRGIKPPELDVTTVLDVPTYCHWVASGGTPIEGK